MRGADLVLFCVKSPDTDAVARAMAPHVDANALVLSLQNGVDNAATIARHVRCAVVPAVVYVATALPAPGTVAHYGRGDLVIGSKDAALQPRLQAVAALFAGAQVPVVVSAEVMVELWRKLMLNCAYNAISAIAQQPYGRMTALAEVRAVMREVVEEVVAVARADGQLRGQRHAALLAGHRVAARRAGRVHPEFVGPCRRPGPAGAGPADDAGRDCAPGQS